MTIKTQQPTKRTVSKRIAFAILILLASATIAYTFSRTPLFATLSTTRLVYSQSALLSETWATFKGDSIEAGSGRTIDSHTTNVTTSRAHSDTLLRSVYIDDKQTFDKAWTWSKTTNQLENKLFASSYGPRADKTYGIINESTDSAADTDTALALLMAYSRWNDTAYLTDAEAIIDALYVNSVATANGSPIMAGTSVTDDATTIAVSPETLNVAAFKEFAKVDPSHNWTGLVNNSYATLSRMLAANNDSLPNTATISLATGTITMSEQNKVFTAASATGVWNLGFDYGWNRDDRDLVLMKKLPIANEYRTTGTVLTGAGESAATYGKLIPYFMAIDPALARSIESTKLLTLYSQDQQAWRIPLSVDDQTWVWSGIGSYNGRLRHLTEDAS